MIEIGVGPVVLAAFERRLVIEFSRLFNMGSVCLLVGTGCGTDFYSRLAAVFHKATWTVPAVMTGLTVLSTNKERNLAAQVRLHNLYTSK